MFFAVHLTTARRRTIANQQDPNPRNRCPLLLAIGHFLRGYMCESILGLVSPTLERWRGSSCILPMRGRVTCFFNNWSLQTRRPTLPTSSEKCSTVYKLVWPVLQSLQRYHAAKVFPHAANSKINCKPVSTSYECGGRHPSSVERLSPIKSNSATQSYC